MSLLRFFGLSVPADFDPIHNFWYGPVGRATAAGIHVDESSALTYSGSWAATMLLCTSGSMLPLKTMERLSGGGSVVAEGHHTYPIVHDAPNGEMSSMMFRASRMAFQINWGNAFGEIVRNRGGQPSEAYPIHSSRIPKGNFKRGADGKPYYLVNNDDGSRTPIPAADMLHFPSPMSEDGIWGIGVVEKAGQSIAFGIATELQGAAYIRGGSKPGIVIKNGKFRDPADKTEFRRQWTAEHGNPEDAGKPYLLPVGAEIQVLSFNPEQSQFIQTRQHNIEEIARWYGVPQHLIQHLLRSTNNNIEHQSLEFVKFSLMRWLVCIEQELNRKLLTPDERKRYFFKHNVDALERADITTRTTALAQQFFNGEITVNEWRSLEDRKPIGPLGDKHFIQTAMAPLEVVAAGPPDEPEEPAEPEDDAPEEEDRGLSSTVQEALATITATVNTLAASMQSGMDSLKGDLDAVNNRTVDSLESISAKVDGVSEQAHLLGLTTNATQHRLKSLEVVQSKAAAAQLRDKMERLIGIEVNNVKRVAEKPDRFDSRLKEFYAKHTATLARELLEPVSVCLAAQGSDRPAGEVVSTLVATHVAESLRQLDSLLDCKVEELPGKVEECVGKWHEERSMVAL